MRVSSNSYNYFLVNRLLKSKEKILICNYSPTKHSSWVVIEQFLEKNGCKSFKIKNKLFLTFLKNNVFNSIRGSINGPVIIILLTNNIDLSTINKLFNINIIKLSNKIHISSQLINVPSLDFKSNLKVLQKDLSLASKLFSITLNKIKKSE